MMLLSKGGIMIWPILGFSILILAVILDRLVALTTFRIPSSGTLGHATTLYKTGKTDEAARMLTEDAPMSAPLFTAILTGKDKGKREQAASRAGEIILFDLEKRMGILSAGAAATPLMGLLGTVLGMIDVFSRVSNAPGGVDIALLADGIWQALLTTAAGMGVAIPALLAYHFFSRLQEKIAFTLQHRGQECVDALEEDQA